MKVLQSKSAGFSDLSALTRASIMIILLLSLGAGTVIWAKGESESAGCEFSVWANDQLQAWPLNCPARSERITGKNQYEVMMAIATELKICWRVMGRGTKAPFGKNFAGADDYCVVCGNYTLPSKSGLEVRKADMIQFLESTPVPGMGVTFSQYLDVGIKKWYNAEEEERKYGDEKIFSYIPDENEGKFIASEPGTLGEPKSVQYLTVFSRETDFFNTWLGGVIGDVGSFAGVTSKSLEERMADEGFMMLYFVKETDLDELTCDYVYWKESKVKKSVKT